MVSSGNVKQLVTLINRHISLGFLYGDFITVLDVVADPFGDVLRGRIDIQHFVDVLMVEGLLDDTLDMGEVGDHSVLVEFFRLAIDDDNPVVAVQVLALAFVVKVQLVTGGYLKCFSDVIH